MRSSLDCGYSGPRAPEELVKYGPTIWVDIGFDPSWRPGPPARKPNAAALRVRALIDTGAEQSFIDCDLAARLKLSIFDWAEVAGSQGRHEVEVYLAQIFIQPLQLTQHGQFAGVHLQRGGMPYQVLIGRTFLEHFTLHYNGRSGQVTLTQMH